MGETQALSTSRYHSLAGPIRFRILPPPDVLKNDVECFRIAEYAGEEVAIRVSPKATPGIVFQHDNGRSAIESISTRSKVTSCVPTSFVYGAGTERSVMRYRAGSYTTIQLILKPHALKTLLGINATTLSNRLVELNEFSAHDLDLQLMEAGDEQARIALLNNFLLKKLNTDSRDRLVEESLRLIHKNAARLHIKHLLQRLNISERQFERRFSQAVGVPPQSYLRVTRFNEAISLIKAGRYDRLTDVAHALDYYDQSHLIREIHEFAGITPKRLSQKEVDFFHGQVGYSFV